MTRNLKNWAKIIVFAFPFVFGCGNQKQSGYSELLKEKPQKNRTTSNLPIEYVFHRQDENACKLYFRIDPKHFLAKFDSLQKKEIQYSLMLVLRSNQLGGKTLFEYEKHAATSQTGSILDSISFSLPAFKSVYYELEIIDENKHVVRRISAFWEREYDVIPEDFLLVDSKSKEILTQSFFDNEVSLLSNVDQEVLRLEIFTNSNTMASRMYQLKENPLYTKPESPEVKMGTLKELNKLINEFPRSAYFRIRARSDERRPSFTFTKISERVDNSMNPLAYFLKEGEALTYAVWIKFWSDASMNDTKKAERLIAEFNRRIEYANNHFGSHKMGWKTDRGMMYILLGPADRVTDDLRSEVWSYGFTSSVSQEFNFARNPNGLNKNDFILDRNLGYRETYLSAVDRWKNGWVKMGWDGNQ